ncbi:SAM-dependent methyltransferase [Mycobacterium sp. 852013-51886_SCH5428379]|uniref:class I SAM-dependent methyltransferase n=1 Tax=Mycobacterium sp. 852013-51886_SCH5428379 TaxID=1834111 RepID=UPI0007FFA701|nr:SAM-dependent methyltransferase [Mycobacterium sp. 852013-51886_SCH5428379]
MAERDAVRWDDRYSRPGSENVGTPGLPVVFNPYAHEFPTRGTALDIACGQGRAAVWLALRGLDVWGVDVSPVALAQAAELARSAGVAARCRFSVVDLDDGMPPGPAVDVVLCHLFRDALLDDQIIARLAPGGLLAVAALSEVGATPGPYRVRPGELRRAFAALDLVADGEGDGVAWLLACRGG